MAWLLQVAYPGAWDLDNGAFGSIAGHPYWDTYIRLLEERASISPAEGPLRYDHVVRSTGPDVTYDVSSLSLLVGRRLFVAIQRCICLAHDGQQLMHFAESAGCTSQSFERS